jgi:hypothetical protein
MSMQKEYLHAQNDYRRLDGRDLAYIADAFVC